MKRRRTSITCTASQTDRRAVRSIRGSAPESGRKTDMKYLAISIGRTGRLALALVAAALPMNHHLEVFVAVDPKRIESEDDEADALFLIRVLQDQPHRETARPL